MIEIAFYKGGEDIMGRAIRLWTRSPYSHCELHFGGGECWSSHPGVGVGWMHRNLSPAAWDLIPIPGATDMEGKLRSWCEGELGCKYDWRGIFFSQAFPWGWHSRDRWFCSEACCAALQQIGLFPGVKAYQQSPRKLYQLALGG